MPSASDDPAGDAGRPIASGITGKPLVSGEDRLALVVFRVGAERFGLPVGAVEHVSPVVEIIALPGAPPAVAGFVSRHGRAVPVLDPRRRFGGSPAEPMLSDRLIFVTQGARSLALLADDVEGLQEVPVDGVADYAALVPGAVVIQGVAATARGLIYVQDAAALMTPGETAATTLALERLVP